MKKKKTTDNTLFCSTCQKKVTFHYNTVDHRKELIRTLLTFGFWLPFWLCMSSSKTKLCDHCDNMLWEGPRI